MADLRGSASAVQPVQSNLRFGQISLLLALFVLVDVILLADRPGQGALPGLRRGQAHADRFRRDVLVIGRRRAATVGAACFLGVAVVGAVVLPSDSWSYWSDHLTRDDLGHLTETGNQSIYAALLRADVHGAMLIALWVPLAMGLLAFAFWRSGTACTGDSRCLARQ